MGQDRFTFDDRTESQPALTVAQPWAWAIVSGRKRIENRGWRTRYRGPLLIHAGKSRKWLGTEGNLLPDRPSDEELVYGAIIGLVDVVDCIPVAQAAGDPFASGPWCWVLENARSIEPVACAGRQTLWTPSAELLQAVRRTQTTR